MKNPVEVAYGQYIIDVENRTYKAVWNCQVEWTEECIFYDAETGRIESDDEEPRLASEHSLKVTKSEYREHQERLRQLPAVTMTELAVRLDNTMSKTA